jgi:hypothetical protein
MILLGRSNNVPPVAWLHDDLTLQSMDLPYPEVPMVFAMYLNTSSTSLPDGSSTPVVVSQIYLNGVYPGIVKECSCVSMSDGGSLELTFAPGT